MLQPIPRPPSGQYDVRASLLVHGTITGACGLLANSNKSPQELRQLVTSPKNTKTGDCSYATLDNPGFSPR